MEGGLKPRDSKKTNARTNIFPHKPDVPFVLHSSIQLCVWQDPEVKARRQEHAARAFLQYTGGIAEQREAAAFFTAPLAFNSFLQVSDMQGVRPPILLASFPPQRLDTSSPRGSGVVKERPAPSSPPRRGARVPRTPVPTVHPPSAGPQTSRAVVSQRGWRLGVWCILFHCPILRLKFIKDPSPQTSLRIFFPLRRWFSFVL